MQTKFKKQQKVRLKINPDPEYIEYLPDFEGAEIKKGAIGKINMLLPNGQYHVEIINEKGEPIAYLPMDEEFLEAVE